MFPRSFGLLQYGKTWRLCSHAARNRWLRIPASIQSGSARAWGPERSGVGGWGGPAGSGGASPWVLPPVPPEAGTVPRSHLPISTRWRPSVVATSAAPADTVISASRVVGSLRTAARLFCLTEATAFENETSAFDFGDSQEPVARSTAPEDICMATRVSLSRPTEFSSTVTSVSACTV